MGQWGEEKIIEEVRFIPHVSTSNAFADIDITDNIDSVIIIGSDSMFEESTDHERVILQEVENRYVGKPYSSWLEDASVISKPACTDVGFIIDKKNQGKLKRMIKDYVEACIADSWKGGGDPRDIPYCVVWKKESKKKLYSFINKGGNK